MHVVYRTFLYFDPFLTKTTVKMKQGASQVLLPSVMNLPWGKKTQQHKPVEAVKRYPQ